MLVQIGDPYDLPNDLCVVNMGDLVSSCREAWVYLVNVVLSLSTTYYCFKSM